ncbi:rolling circle replication-associated protein [Reinekea thalattae]|uniref:Uncharacterized protein n=1 Tax=Reinekea thalattae TaxID=2593301 RepID=A0A5C8Z3D1_9GAMM|nr:hypothetical protein [Reinekea thalattae]TXR52057.1 hypothetical protein FME95_11620 [Reinekea thalattae]
MNRLPPELKEFMAAQDAVFLVPRSGMTGVSEANAHRLVKASKSATRENSADLAAELEIERQRLESINQRHFVAVGGLENKNRMLAKAREYQQQAKACELSPLEKSFQVAEREAEQFYSRHAAGFGSYKKPIGKPLTEAEIQNRVDANNKFQCSLTENERGPGRYAILEKRWWSGEFRIRTQADKLASMPVPDNSGERISKTLSMRGARAIADSCEFMAAKHGGYKTFLTLTFSDEARERVASGEVTIQKEVKRFFDGLNRVFKRGFQYTNDKGELVKVDPVDYLPKDWGDKTLPYCWVVEIPKNSDGEDNPHLHVLLGWRVAYRHFDAWAKRVEKLWGQGFAHLEKIKEAEHAGAYMAKAAGYLSKAQGADDQGEVRGNRYWISKPSRADGWECISRNQAGEMGGLIRDVYRFMQFKYGHVFKKRAELSKEAAELRKAAKNGEAIPEKKRQSVGKALTQCRQFIKELPARATKYSLILKGEHNLGAFLNWAARPYDKNHVPKRLHKDGELKAYWLPVAFGKRRGWRCDNAPESIYYHTLKQERKHNEKRISRTKNGHGVNEGGIKSVLKSEARRAAYAAALGAC